MARLGRGQPAYQTGHSKLGPPTVVTAAPIFFGPQITYWAAVKSKQNSELTRRQPYSTLRPPTVVGPAVVYPGPTSTFPVRDADEVERRRSNWNLRPPQVVTAASTDVFSGPKVELARAKPGDPRRKAQPDLGAPTVINPGGQMGGVGTSLADASNARGDGRRAPSSRLAAPQVVTAATTFIADAVRVWRTEPHRPITTKSALRAPTVVGPVQVYTGPPRVLTEPHKPAPTHSDLRPPQVVDAAAGFIAERVRTSLVPAPRSNIRRRRFTRLQGPVVVDPVQVYGPVNLTLAPARKPRLVQFELRPPTVIITAGPTDDTVDVTLAPSRDVPRRLAKSELRAPTVLNPAVVYPSVSTTLVPSPRLARAPRSELRAPQVVTEVFNARAVAVSLAPSSNLARSTHSKLRRPTVVDPVQLYGPVDTKLVPSPREARGTHTRLRPPTVVFPFIPPALAVNLRVTGQETGKRRPVHSRLRPPTVITLPVDVIYIDYYDHPEPRGILSSLPREGTYGTDSGGITSSSPDSGSFDTPKPIGEMD